MTAGGVDLPGAPTGGLARSAAQQRTPSNGFRPPKRPTAPSQRLAMRRNGERRLGTTSRNDDHGIKEVRTRRLHVRQHVPYHRRRLRRYRAGDPRRPRSGARRRQVGLDFFGFGEHHTRCRSRAAVMSVLRVTSHVAASACPPYRPAAKVMWEPTVNACAASLGQATTRMPAVPCSSSPSGERDVPARRRLTSRIFHCKVVPMSRTLYQRKTGE